MQTCQISRTHRHKHKNFETGLLFSDSPRCDTIRYLGCTYGDGYTENAVKTGTSWSIVRSYTVMLTRGHDKSPTSMPYGDDMKSKVYCVFQTALERRQTVISTSWKNSNTEGSETSSDVGRAGI